MREPEALSEEMMGVWRQVALGQPYFEATSRMNMCALRWSMPPMAISMSISKMSAACMAG